MTTGTPLPAFEHDPLPEHKSHFRLLQIVRGDFGQHVECELSAWPVSDAPPYYAISYTWGDPEDTTEITVNGRPFVVRRNCEYVLQQVFATKASKYFWVDAICIDQTTKEKNHQVRIMGQIYSGAKHVLACVGPHENDSEFLPQITKGHHSLLRKIRGLMEPIRFQYWNHPIDFRLRTLLHCFVSMEGKTRQRLYESFCSFMRRSYFKRLWIMQELHLANSVSYCFGTAVQEAEDFLALCWLLEFWKRYDQLRYTSSVWRNPFRFITRCLLGLPRIKACLAFRLERPSHGSEYDLLGFACTSANHDTRALLLNPNVECSDPRDRLFGILSFVDWRFGWKPEADYGKDCFEVAVDAMNLLSRRPRVFDSYLNAKRLCDIFKITGEERSLRKAIDLRTSTSRTEADSDGIGGEHGISEYFTWRGFEILGSAEKFRLSRLNSDMHFGVYLSAQEKGGCCVLNLRNGSKEVSIQAPLDTKEGDWWIFEYTMLKRRGLTGLVVRKSQRGTYTTVGQAFSLEGLSLSPYRAMVLLAGNVTKFYSRWFDEDILFLGWKLKELDSKNITLGQINDFVNMRVCAWDGSSYFKEVGPDLSQWARDERLRIRGP
jgi:hypothetical protein